MSHGPGGNTRLGKPRDRAAEGPDACCQLPGDRRRCRSRARARGISSAGAKEEIGLWPGASREILAGSIDPSEALVGVPSQAPSAPRALMLPDEPGVSP